jgi:hypothetical protein
MRLHAHAKLVPCEANGAIAQLGERRAGSAEVIGSIPISSIVDVPSTRSPGARRSGATCEVPHFADERGLVAHRGIERQDDIGRGVLVSTGLGDGAYPSTSGRTRVRVAPSACSSTSG